MILRDTAQDFMSTVASISFIQYVWKYTQEDHDLNCIFSLVGAICICFYESNTLLKNRLLSGKRNKFSFAYEAEQIELIFFQMLMKQIGFQKALENVFSSLADHSVSDLVAIWNNESSQVFDTIAIKHSLSSVITHNASWCME